MVIICGALCHAGINWKHWRAKSLYVCGIVMIALSASMLALMAVSYSYEYRWSKAARYALRGHSREMMPQYAELYKHYHRNPSFLYNYAAEQFYASQYKGALKTATECWEYWPSYNLSLLTGDICRAAGWYDKAVAYYETAHYMCPVRFAPLEGLYYAYKLKNEPWKADSIAELVEKKKIKVNSVDVQRIKAEIHEDIQNRKMGSHSVKD